MKQTYRGSSGEMVSMLLGGVGEPHTIVWISSPDGQRGKGLAKALLAEVCKEADEAEVTLVAELVRGERFTNVKRLEKLFAGAGFVLEDPPINHRIMMKRLPQAILEEGETTSAAA